MTTDTHPKPDPEREQLILRHLAKWEDANGTLCAITPDEWMALMEPIANLAVLESPRQALTAWNRRSSSIPAGDVGKVVEALMVDIEEFASTRVRQSDGRLNGRPHRTMEVRAALREKLAAALASLRGAALLPQMTTWQPIETAPKNGTTIIVARHMGNFGWVRGTAEWRGHGHIAGWVSRGFDDTLSNLGLAHPTHWMPPPTPPGLEGDSQKDANHG